MDPIYLDHAATTPLRPEVGRAMASCMAERFGNPSSRHRFGRVAAAALEEARERIADALGARRSEIRFVRGGTESDNLAILGRSRRVARDAAADLPAPGTPTAPGVPTAPTVTTVVHSAVEHSAVLEASRVAESEGARRVSLPVDATGALTADALRTLDRLTSATPKPAVVSLMWVNNEVGTVFPLAALARRVAESGSVLHTDAVQAVGKIPVRVDEAPVHLLTLTGHKIGGPRGTGVLFVREGTELEPLVHGGGQERGLRPGTEDVAGAVGVAEALALVVEERGDEAPRLEELRDRLGARLRERIDGLRVHGEGGVKAPHILSVGIPGVDGGLLVDALDVEGVAVSGGSACHSGASGGTSHVLEALYGEDGPGGPAGPATWAAVRFSLGRETTEKDVLQAADVTAAVVERMTELGGGSP